MNDFYYSFVINCSNNLFQTAEKTCPAGKVHLDCGPVEPKTCLTVFKPIKSLSTVNHCNDACYCPDGTVQDGDKCVAEETCGCFYDDEYFEVGIELLFVYRLNKVLNSTPLI